MTIDEFLRTVRDRWVVVVACLLVGALCGGLFALLSPPEYTATTTLYVYSPVADNPDAAYQGSQVSQQRVSSYTELVTSEEVTDDVIARLDLPESSGELARHLSATSSSGSVLIDLAAQDSDPARAAGIANQTAASFIAVVDDLERPQAPGATQQVFVRPVRPAKVPTISDNPSAVVTVGVGAVLGLVVGVVLALLLGALDTSVRTIAQLRALTGLPNLGSMPSDPKAVAGVVTGSLPAGTPYAEALRALRTNLDFVDVDHPTSVLVITSPLEAEGKTMTAVGLAVALASVGRRVVLVDADLRHPRIAQTLGFDDTVGLTTVLAGKATLDAALQPWGPGLTHLLTSGVVPPNPSELLASHQARDLFAALRERADVVVVDTPPVLPVTDAATVSRWADATILLCRMGRTRTASVESAITALRAVSANVAGTVASMVQTRDDVGHVGRTSSYRSPAPASRPGRSETRARPTGSAGEASTPGFATATSDRPTPETPAAGEPAPVEPSPGGNGAVVPDASSASGGDAAADGPAREADEDAPTTTEDDGRGTVVETHGLTTVPADDEADRPR